MIKYNKELAEFVGIMLGDGYINYPKQPRIKITLNSITDKDYLIFVKNLLSNIFQVNIIEKQRKKQNAADLFIFNRNTIRLIINKIQLIPSPKWNRAIIPSWIFERGLEKYVIRGYFDTDGCVVITDNNGIRYPRLEMKVSPSPMQEQFQTILRKYNFKFGTHNIGKGKVRIQLNGKKELKKWNELIGFSNPKHQVKFNSFL